MTEHRIVCFGPQINSEGFYPCLVPVPLGIDSDCLCWSKRFSWYKVPHTEMITIFVDIVMQYLLTLCPVCTIPRMTHRAMQLHIYTSMVQRLVQGRRRVCTRLCTNTGLLPVPPLCTMRCSIRLVRKKFNNQLDPKFFFFFFHGCWSEALESPVSPPGRGRGTCQTIG